MERRDHGQELEDVLDAYVADGAPSHARLTEWTRRYPRYARDLAEFTAAWSAMAWLPPSAPPTDEAALVRRGMGTVGALLRERAPATANQDAIASLLQEGRARGLAVDGLAARAGLSVPLVLKLDRRLIRFATLPRTVIESVASALERDVSAVAAYLSGGPRLAPSASYHARQAPALAGQEDFADAVRADLTLPDDRRAQLLALEPMAGREAE